MSTEHDDLCGDVVDAAWYVYIQTFFDSFFFVAKCPTEDEAQRIRTIVYDQIKRFNGCACLVKVKQISDDYAQRNALDYEIQENLACGREGCSDVECFAALVALEYGATPPDSGNPVCDGTTSFAHSGRSSVTPSQTRAAEGPYVDDDDCGRLALTETDYAILEVLDRYGVPMRQEGIKDELMRMQRDRRTIKRGIGAVNEGVQRLRSCGLTDKTPTGERITPAGRDAVKERRARLSE